MACLHDLLASISTIGRVRTDRACGDQHEGSLMSFILKKRKVLMMGVSTNVVTLSRPVIPEFRVSSHSCNRVSVSLSLCRAQARGQL